MDALDNIELYDCPLCNGPALLEEEDGWCLHVICLDCGCSTVNTGFRNEEERLKAAQRSADLWNMGKVIACGPGE